MKKYEKFFRRINKAYTDYMAFDKQKTAEIDSLTADTRYSNGYKQEQKSLANVERRAFHERNIAELIKNREALEQALNEEYSIGKYQPDSKIIALLSVGLTFSADEWKEIAESAKGNICSARLVTEKAKEAGYKIEGGYISKEDVLKAYDKEVFKLQNSCYNRAFFPPYYGDDDVYMQITSAISAVNGENGITVNEIPKTLTDEFAQTIASQRKTPDNTEAFIDGFTKGDKKTLVNLPELDEYEYEGENEGENKSEGETATPKEEK